MAGTSEGNKRAAATRKKLYGKDTFAKMAKKGNHKGQRGYLGRLKDEGRLDELKAVTQKGNAASQVVRRTKSGA